MIPLTSQTPVERFQNSFLRIKRSFSGFASEDGLPQGALILLADVRRLCHDSCGGIRVSDLAAASGFSMPAASRILRSLLEKGLVERRPARDDRRVAYIRLTPGGELQLNQTGHKLSARMDEILTRLGPEDGERFLALVERVCVITEELRQKKAPPHTNH